MVLGTAGHAAAETHLRAKRETWTDGPLDVALDAYSDSFDKESYESPEDPDKDETKPVFKDKGVKAVKFWHKEVAPDLQPDLIEEPISFSINGLNYTGTLDMSTLDRAIVDHKFTSRTPSGAESYILNMVGYAIGYREKTGETESRVELSNVVMLKDTKHVKISSDGPVPDKSIEAFAEILTDVNRGIQAGVFPPSGLNTGACSWCGYTSLCSAYQNSPMKRS